MALLNNEHTNSYVGTNASDAINVSSPLSTSADVQKHYAEVALGVLENMSDETVCGCETCEGTPNTASEARNLYTQDILDNLPEAAKAASRGCGDPVSKANLQSGEYVVDLGSGGGIDALIASRFVGETGYVYGIDMTPEMISLATENATTAGIANVEFVQGEIENIPLPNEAVDVVLSNCVVNFSDDKPRVMREAYRVLKPGGRFVVSDIVSYAPIAPSSYEPLCRIVGCTKGMNTAVAYQQMLEEAGFSRVTLEPKTTYTLEVLCAKAEAKDRLAFYDALAQDPSISEASGSVIIYAYKD